MLAIHALLVILAVSSAPMPTTQAATAPALNVMGLSAMQTLLGRVATLERENAQLRKDLAAAKAGTPTTAPAPVAASQPAWPKAWEKSFDQAMTKPANLILQRLEIGRVGYIWNTKIRVEQVMTASDVLAGVTVDREGYAPPLGHGYAPLGDRSTAYQTMTLDDMLVAQKQAEAAERTWQSCWIQGVNTAGMADGQTVNLPGMFLVSRTKRYATALGGSRTVFVLEPVDEVTWRAAYAAWQKRPKAGN